MPVSRRPETEVTVLVVGLITGIMLIIIGSAMDKVERARRDRDHDDFTRWTRR